MYINFNSIWKGENPCRPPPPPSPRRPCHVAASQGFAVCCLGTSLRVYYYKLRESKKRAAAAASIALGSEAAASFLSSLLLSFFLCWLVGWLVDGMNEAIEGEGVESCDTFRHSLF